MSFATLEPERKFIAGRIAQIEQSLAVR
jgi:hypothetical protein